MANTVAEARDTEKMDSAGAQQEVTATHAPPSRPKRPSKGRVFQCTGYPDCNMSFTRSEHLARHLRKHTGERPFTCPHCAKSFSRLDNLRQHKQTVHACDPLSMHGNREEYADARLPQTPYHPSATSYNGRQLPPVLISPANSTSPNPRYQDSRSHQYMPHDNGLKIPTHQFKPKRRPRPLSLLNSFVDKSMQSTEHAITFLRPPLHSAPPIPFDKSRQMAPYPGTSHLAPSMVSPLSPLFHQSFSQMGSRPSSALPSITSQNNVTHLTSPYASSAFRFSAPNLNLPAALPSVKQLCLGSHNLSNSVLISDTGSSLSLSPSSAMEPAPAKPKEDKEQNRKTWLLGVLNDETSKPASKDKESNTSISGTRKATINSLLSPQ